MPAVMRARLKYVVIATFITTLLLCFGLYKPFDITFSVFSAGPGWTDENLPNGRLGSGGRIQNATDEVDAKHPISLLIEEAYNSFSLRLGKRSWSLAQAAVRYRERRGRHPPPGFDKWYEAAQSHEAVIVEEFFDRIHHDINPFWGVDALEMRHQARAMPHIIRVRDGKIANFKGDNEGAVRGDRLELWETLIKDMLPHIPDLDMPVNLYDEPRMLVPWEDVTRYVAEEQSSRQLFPPDKVTAEQTSLKDLDAYSQQAFDPEWTDDKPGYWNYISHACPPDSPARKVLPLETMADQIDTIFPTSPIMSYMEENGFIKNFTQAQIPCLQPHLRGMHGTFVEAFSMSISTKLFPFFSGSKLSTNNELLIPGAMYLSEQTRYSGGTGHGGPWSEKKNGLVWRGAASGGRNQEDNWWHYQRHRFVQMMNGSTVTLVQAGNAVIGPTFNRQALSMYNISVPLLGPWLQEWSDVGFNRLDCWPERHDWLNRLRPDCPYTDPFFALVPSKPMAEQYSYKFLPDVDGNSFSARWRGFLQSTSCPLKATVYTEWHDDRLVPWLHFVPFDNTFMDIYAIMDYFLNGHDAEARRVAEEGHAWAAKVLRREDMMLYTWRLLLEYARVLDPNRDRLGFVDDLIVDATAAA
ncbi:lipopolysaccharide-modifying protein [Xylaria nigripes]|nr:lipopolysaccharide-modifying protein [Xylaria nigripes]